MAVRHEEYAFRNGWFRVPQGRAFECKSEIKKMLNITSDTAFYHRLNGIAIPSQAEVQAIEAIFARYGVTDIWGVE